MSPHCTPCETASHMEERNVEGGSHRHHSWPGMPKYKTWLKRRGGGKLGKKLGFVLWRAARLPTCWSPQTQIFTHYLHNLSISTQQFSVDPEEHLEGLIFHWFFQPCLWQYNRIVCRTPADQQITWLCATHIHTYLYLCILGYSSHLLTVRGSKNITLSLAWTKFGTIWPLLFAIKSWLGFTPGSTSFRAKCSTLERV